MLKNTGLCEQTFDVSDSMGYTVLRDMLKLTRSLRRRAGTVLFWLLWRAGAVGAVERGGRAVLSGRGGVLSRPGAVGWAVESGLDRAVVVVLRSWWK